MLRAIHVYDLDGVLVDTSHRYRNLENGSIDLDYWFANRDKMDRDETLPHAHKFFLDCANPHIYTVIATARIYDPRDVSFIASRLGTPNKLIMRMPKNATLSDKVLKRRELSRLFNLRQFKYLPRFLWEDNPITIEHLRDLFTRTFLIPSKIWGK